MNLHVKRASARENREAVIQIHTSWDQTGFPVEKLYFKPARLMNQSSQGMGLEIDRTVPPGSMISIKMAAPDTQNRTAYRLHRGRVCWCHKLPAKKTTRYGMGVQIHETVIQAVLDHPRLNVGSQIK